MKKLQNGDQVLITLGNIHRNLIILPVEQDNAPLIFEESYHQRLYDEQKRSEILLLKYI